MRTNSQAQGSTGSEPTKQETLESCFASVCLHVSNQKAEGWPSHNVDRSSTTHCQGPVTHSTIDGRQPVKWQSPMRRKTAVCFPNALPPMSTVQSVHVTKKRLEESLFPYHSPRLLFAPALAPSFVPFLSSLVVTDFRQTIPNQSHNSALLTLCLAREPSVSMKASVILSLMATAVATSMERRARLCGGDNCARQVTGTRDGLKPLESRKADCTSFMRTTIVPDPVTTTVTVTIGGDSPKLRRDDVLDYRAAAETLTAVPAYASACADGTKYSSACSCWGITAAVTTGPTPTKTQIVTVWSDYCDDL
ncbi:hypothetical protein PCL_09570 [Purpureocillium lilacinum]|uniref:Uncharacterized protein n=1 Tax=Purpureocillium lilacinum TaxID=33203 RepID=A0A2U3DQJ4_PURLI|nr:hypothetical protein PCL_09570 [Purpureocillium lilacinum]